MRTGYGLRCLFSVKDANDTTVRIADSSGKTLLLQRLKLGCYLVSAGLDEQGDWIGILAHSGLSLIEQGFADCIKSRIK